MSLADRYQEIKRRVEQAAQRSSHRQAVTLIAVSKQQPVSVIEELYHLGHRDFGENYVQELVEKAEYLEARGLMQARFHYIGHLQSNKVKAMIARASVVHSVDSERLAQEIAKRWVAAQRPGKLPIFIETKLDDEPNKTGVEPEQVPGLCQRLAQLPDLSIQGLMCIPSPESGATGAAFARLRDLELKCRPSTQGQLSMGMTQDFETAIAEGATHVRVGTAIFGPRAPR